MYELFEEHNIDFITLDEQIDTSSPAGRAMMKIFLVFAELEREQTSERTKSKMKWRAEQGLWNGGQILGYDLDPNEKGILKVNDGEAELINSIFQTYIGEGSLLKTANTINEKGHRTKEFHSRRGKFHKGKPFNNTAISRILKNTAYIGYVSHYGKNSEGKHEGIVPKEIFDRANNLLKSNRITRTNYKQEMKRHFLLNGLIKCGYCGSNMTSKYSRGRSQLYYYYQCTGNAHGGKERCEMKYVPAEDVEGRVVQEIKKVAESLDLIKEVVAEANKEGWAKIEEMKKHKKALENKLPSLRDDMEACLQWMRKNPPDEESMQIGKKVMDDLGDKANQESQILQEIETLDLQVMEFEQSVLNAEVAKESLVRFSELYDVATDEQKSTLLQLLISQIIFHPDEIKIQVYGDLKKKANFFEGGCSPDGALRVNNGSGCRTRTCDPVVNSHLLYQLS